MTKIPPKPKKWTKYTKKKKDQITPKPKNDQDTL